MDRIHARVRGLASGLVVLGALAAIAVGVSRVTVDTGIESFVPSGDAAYDDLAARDRDFGGDPVVVLLKGTSRDGLLVDPDQLTRLVRLEGTLANLPDVAVVYGPGTVLNQTATSVKNVLLQMFGRRDALENTARARAEASGKTKAEVQEAVTAALARFDSRYGALIVQAMPMGLPSLQNRRFVSSVMFDGDGEPRPEWRFLAPTAKSATLLVRPRAGLDQDGTRRLVARVRTAVGHAGLKTDKPVVTGVPVLTSAVAAQARHEAPRLGAVALLGVALVLLLMPWSRRIRDRLRPLLPVALGTGSTLALFGLLGRPLSLGVVAFLPIVLGIGSDFPLYLSQPTNRRKVLVASGGAVLAFATLGLSQLPFVREFGLALSLGVAATVGWALVLRVRLPEVAPAAPATAAITETSGRGRRWRIAAALVGVAAALAGWALLPGSRIESRPDQLAQGLPELADVTRAESTLGFSGEVSVVVRGADVLSPEVLAWARKADAALLDAHADSLRPLLTFGRLLEFLGDDATPDEVTAGSGLLPPYLLDAVVGRGGRVASSTFGVALDDVAEQRDLVKDIRRILPPAPSGYDVKVVGLPVVAASGLSAMSASRYLIGFGGLAAALLVVGIGLRSRRTVLLVASAALLSGGWVYLVLRLVGGELNPLTLAVGALITVTACEFTVMLRGRGHAAWLGHSVATAATAGTVGYLCLGLSDLAVLRDFGFVLAGGVAASYAAARLVVALAADRERRQHSTHPAGSVAEAASSPDVRLPREEVLSCP